MGNKLKRLLMWMGAWLGFNALFYWLNRNRKRVLTFHNVLPDDLYREMQDIPDGITLPESRFRAIVRHLKNRFRFSVDFSDSSTLTITFDDGYANQAETAARILAEEGDIPAVLFVSGRAVCAKNPRDALVPDRLIFWAQRAPMSIVEKAWGLTGRSALISKLFDEVRKDGTEQGENLMRKLDGLYPFGRVFDSFSAVFNQLRFCGFGEKTRDMLLRRGWRVGWHTENHYQLSCLAIEDIQRELTVRNGYDATIMSYPFGSCAHVGAEAPCVAKKLGYALAFSNCVVHPKFHTALFAPRFVLQDDPIAIDFELSGFKHFIKYRTLLPQV